MQTTSEKLEKYRTAAQAAIPGLGNRLDSAVELSRTANYLGEQFNVDWWIVDGHKCSIKGHTCSCNDNSAPVLKKTGKVCKHRLAVMFATKLRKENGQELTRILDGIAGSQGGRLYVNVTFNEPGVPDRWRIKGYFVEGSTRKMLGSTPEDWLEIGVPELIDALDLAGLQITQKTRQAGFDFVWWLSPSAKTEEQPDVRTVTGSLDAATVEHRETETYLNNLLKAEVQYAR